MNHVPSFKGVEGIIDRVFEKEELRDFFFENVPICFLAINDEGVIVDCNKAFYKGLGYERSEVIGKVWSEFVHPDDLEKSIKLASENVVRKTFVKGLGHFDNRYISKDGTFCLVLRWFEGKALYFNSFYMAYALIIDQKYD